MKYPPFHELLAEFAAAKSSTWPKSPSGRPVKPRGKGWHWCDRRGHWWHNEIGRDGNERPKEGTIPPLSSGVSPREALLEFITSANNRQLKGLFEALRRIEHPDRGGDPAIAATVGQYLDTHFKEET